ncbi:hypothetical protein TIFTF001_008159 [Ficus carica]|uniref:Uncharacterized protein n=1 Tax=Ficus carica TaxID=3494 RepID=A0AA88A7Z2_FICCA|nr:hypothetical protein TIFTF001_008159 [Ficus carica]
MSERQSLGCNLGIMSASRRGATTRATTSGEGTTSLGGMNGSSQECWSLRAMVSTWFSVSQRQIDNSCRWVWLPSQVMVGAVSVGQV